VTTTPWTPPPLACRLRPQPRPARWPPTAGHPWQRRTPVEPSRPCHRPLAGRRFPPSPSPSSPSLLRCGDVEPNPGPPLPPAATCPDPCAPTTGHPRRGHKSWLRHRQLVIEKRSPEYQALRGAGLIDAGHRPRGLMTRARAEGGAVGTTLGGASSTGWPRRWPSTPQAPQGPPPRADASTGGACLALCGLGPTPPAGGIPPVLRGCGGQSRPATPGLGGGGLRGPARPGAGGVLPPGHRPCEGCL